MRVDVIRSTVGRPAGVTDAQTAGNAAFRLDLCSQICQKALGLDGTNAVGEHCDACGVVSAVLQLGKTGQQELCCFTMTDKANNSTHKNYLQGK